MPRADADAGTACGLAPLSPLARISRNFGTLISGRAVAALFSLIATAILARALTPVEFGLVILVHTYIITVNGLFNFKPFEAVIRYGVPALENSDHACFGRLLRACLRIDILSSLGGGITAFAGAALVVGFFDWDAALIGLAQIYSLVLLFNITGTAKGVLRLYSRFDVIGGQLVVAPAVRCLGAAVAWALDAPLAAYVLIWATAMLSSQFYLALQGWLEARRHLEPALLRQPLGNWRGEFPGITSFVHVVYWQSNIDLVPKQAVTLFAGALLGPTAAGLFRLAREISGVLATPAVLLRQVLFPDFARMWHQGGHSFARVLLRVILFAGACGLVVVAVSIPLGAPLLGFVYGNAYTAAAPLLSLLLFAGSIELCVSVLRAAGYALGAAGGILKLNLVSLALYICILLLATPRWGLNGAGFAACASAVMMLVGMLVLVKLRAPATTHSTPDSE